MMYAVLREISPGRHDRDDRFVDVNGRYVWDSVAAAYQCARLHADITPTASTVTYTVVYLIPMAPA